MTSKIADIAIGLIKESRGNIHDIEHFMKVYAYAKIIAEKEMLDPQSRVLLECAALLHDIACPLCREKYGCTDGPLQEKEGAALAASFLEQFNLPEDFTANVAWLIGHHHTYSNVEKPEHRILLEADFLVNAAESRYDKDTILAAQRAFFRTETGSNILRDIYFHLGDEG